MGEVIELRDHLAYITDKETGNILGVNWFRHNQYVDFMNDGLVHAVCNKPDGIGMQPHELRQLMIMWLAINYPDTLNYDELKREERIRNEAEDEED